MRIMQTRVKPIRGCLLAVVMLICLAAPRLLAADIQIPSLRIGTDVFTNVTVYQVTETDIFVRHERGFGNAKVSNLDVPTLRLLGIKNAKTEEQEAGGRGRNMATVDKVNASLAAMNLKLPANSAVLGDLSQVKLTPQILAGGLALLVIGYLFSCLVLKKVCVNAGSEPGPLIWLPVLQVFPLLRAARIPAWWFVILLIPGLNLLAHILWSLRIARACGKGGFVAVMLILPLTNILALLYLAFSDGNEKPVERTMKPEDLPGLAGA